MNKSIDWILLIDDDPVFTWLAHRMIVKLNDSLTVKTFVNGEDAFVFLKERYAPKDSYLLILDINMPIMNGWELVDAIAVTDTFAQNKDNLAIYIVSSSIDPKDKDKAGQLSMVKGYFGKPLEIDDMKLILASNGG